MRKLLVAMRPEVLDVLGRFLDVQTFTEGSPLDEARRAVRQARALYAGVAPGVQVAPCGKASEEKRAKK